MVTHLLREVSGLTGVAADAACDVVAAVEKLSNVCAIFLHGSYTRAAQVAGSDVDVIVIVPTVTCARHVATHLPSEVHARVPVFASAYTDGFSWFRRLWSFYIAYDSMIGVDLGIVARDELAEFYVEPDAIILRDWGQSVKMRQRQCITERISARKRWRSRSEYEVYHAAMKVAKAIRRGHLWDAFEGVNLLRRAAFSILRSIRDPPEYIHVGRPERRIDVDYRESTSEMWRGTIPSYCPDQIACAALKIVAQVADLLTREGDRSSSPVLDQAIGALRQVCNSVDIKDE